MAVFPEHRATICSGVLVADGVVLTAGHCISDDSLRVGTWAPSGWHATVRDVEVHPSLDVAVVWIDPDRVPDTLTPIPLLQHPIDTQWAGTTVELAGLGATEYGELGQLRFASEPIVALTDDTIVVNGHGESGACTGDSGGPLLAYDDGGRVRVVGVLDEGHVSCVRDDHYTRVDVLAEWWPFEAHATNDVERGCGGVDTEGLCVRGRAVRCTDERIEVETCDAGLQCGQCEGTAGFRCVHPDDDVCDGHGSQTWCDGATCMRCEGGHVQLDCG